ncbi:MAG: hypothetical protein OCU12_02560 [Methanophagales archaeon]|nr:hypothetical protein [Methanophagales archaeon]
MKESGFLEAFKQEFMHQARVKFGRSAEMSAFERCCRLLGIALYILALCSFTHFRLAFLHDLLVFAGYLWASKIAVESIRGIYHRRRVRGLGQNFREVDDFKFSEKVLTYFISALALTGVFAGSMILIEFFFFGRFCVNYLFLALLSVVTVLATTILGRLGSIRKAWFKV